VKQAVKLDASDAAQIAIASLCWISTSVGRVVCLFNITGGMDPDAVRGATKAADVIYRTYIRRRILSLARCRLNLDGKVKIAVIATSF